MTTQNIACQAISSDMIVNFIKTATDDQWNELVDETNSYSLGRIMDGKMITHLSGSYTAGGAMLRIRNLVSRQIHEFLPLPIITEEKPMKLKNPLVVDKDDVMEVFCVEVPT